MARRSVSSPLCRRARLSAGWPAARRLSLAAVPGGLLRLGEACKRYDLTIDEYLSWYRQVSRHGLAGLRATKIQDYRNY
jgi:hypothetical protein